jgi:hypothetical protein
VPFPNSRESLEEHGYSFSHDELCPCGVWVALWNTPKGNMMPLEFHKLDSGQEVCTPHFASPCPHLANYSRRLRAKQEAASTDAPMSPDA